MSRVVNAGAWEYGSMGCDAMRRDDERLKAAV